MDALTAADFARVRELAISDAIVRDRGLAENLRCASSVAVPDVHGDVLPKERKKGRQ
jgi:hypothetical protein